MSNKKGSFALLYTPKEEKGGLIGKLNDMGIVTLSPLKGLCGYMQLKETLIALSGRTVAVDELLVSSMFTGIMHDIPQMWEQFIKDLPNLCRSHRVTLIGIIGVDTENLKDPQAPAWAATNLPRLVLEKANYVTHMAAWVEDWDITPMRWSYGPSGWTGALDMVVASDFTKQEAEVQRLPETTRNMEYQHRYDSNRGLPLMWRRKPLDKPVLTVEHYCKWYDLFLVMPDGTVKSVFKDERDAWDKAEDKWGGITMADHNFHPEFIPVLAHYLGACIDPEAHEVISGRWNDEIAQTTSLWYSTGFSSEEKLDEYIKDCRKGK